MYLVYIVYIVWLRRYLIPHEIIGVLILLIRRVNCGKVQTMFKYGAQIIEQQLQLNVEKGKPSAEDYDVLKMGNLYLLVVDEMVKLLM